MKKNITGFPGPTLALFAALFCAAFAAAAAQTEEQGLLYFPPKLKVEASTDESWWYRIFSPALEESAPASTLQNRIVFNRSIDTYSLLPLPIVFFDPGSYVIPERYQQFTGSGQADQYVDSAAVEIKSDNQGGTEDVKYYEILNIIGYRLTQSPQTTISLEGGYSTEPGESAELAAERAQILKEYLMNIWHIESERIALLPPRRMCDSAANILKQEEARRVVISSDSISLFRSVNYSTSNVSNALIVFSVFIDPQRSPEEVAAIDLVMASGDDIFGSTSIPISPDSTTYRFTALGGIPRKIEDIEDNIVVQAFVRAQDGTVRASNQVLLPFVIEEEKKEEYLYETETSDQTTMVTTEDETWQEETEEEFGYEPEADPDAEIYSDASVDVDTTWTPPEPAYPPMPPSYSYTIPFYESGDTSLSGLQQIWFRDAVDSLTRHLAAAPEIQWEVQLTASGERGEIPGIADEQIAAQIGMFRRIRSYYSDLAEDRSFRMSLYIIPVKPMQVSEMENFTNDIITSLINAWYGDRAEEINSVQKEFTALYSNSDFTEQERSLIDTFLTHRSEDLGTYFRTGFDTAVIDTVIIGRRSGSLAFQFADTPEKRFYSRQVFISITPNYRAYYDDDYADPYYDGEYNEEYDGQDSTEMEEEYPYEEGAIEEEGSEEEYREEPYPGEVTPQQEKGENEEPQ